MPKPVERVRTDKAAKEELKQRNKTLDEAALTATAAAAQKAEADKAAAAAAQKAESEAQKIARKADTAALDQKSN